MSILEHEIVVWGDPPKVGAWVHAGLAVKCWWKVLEVGKTNSRGRTWLGVRPARFHEWCWLWLTRKEGV